MLKVINEGKEKQPYLSASNIMPANIIAHDYGRLVNQLHQPRIVTKRLHCIIL